MIAHDAICHSHLYHVMMEEEEEQDKINNTKCPPNVVIVNAYIIDIINELILQGATIDAVGKDGQTPLHIAADKVTVLLLYLSIR